MLTQKRKFGVKSETPIKVGEVSGYLPFFSAHPIFSIYSAAELKVLILGCTAQTYELDTIIVTEGELIDAVYFIVEGQCEVRKHVAVAHDATSEMLIATLGKGESIGLGMTGLFSVTGSRTATVVAMSEVVVLRISIEVFRQFIQNHSKTEELSQQLATLTRMSFIKSTAPFATIPNEKVKSIAEKIEEVTLAEGVTIFEQGDPANACYIVMTGMVDISIRSSDGSSKNLAELGPSSIFGESALMMDSARNATARTLIPTTLLKISKTLFYEITRQQVNIPEALMQLQLRRARPIKLNDIDIYTQKKSDGSEFSLLRNVREGKYFQLSEQGLFIWNLLDGETSLNDIVLQFYVRFGSLNIESITKHILNLYKAGFIHLDINEKLLPADKTIPRWLKVFSQIRDVMEIKVAFGNADEWVTKVFNGGAWILFTRPAILLWILLTSLGFVAFIYHFEQAIYLLSVSDYKWRLFFLMNFLSLFIIPLHELAHALTTKFYGRIVHCFGLGWLWFGPFAFCDTSDMWLSPRNQRLVVDLSGIFLNMILAGIAGLCTLLTYPNHENLTICLELFALYSYLMTVANLNTAFELDGYYALMDILDKPNLRLSAIRWLIQLFSSKKAIEQSSQVSLTWKSMKMHYREVIYWLVTLVYILVIGTILPYILLTYLLAGLFGVKSLGITIILTVIAIVISSFSLYKDVIRHVD